VSLPVVAERSSLATSNTQPATSKGDCVDCNMCVQVCPTGIDIRDGLQFECITCTQCIDACDAVMDKIKRPRGLIRYTSQAALEGRARHIIRPRVLIYAGVITALLSLLTYFIITKSPFDVHLVRQGGLPFIIAPDGRAENVMRLNLTNRSEVAQKLTVEVVNAPDVELSGIDQVAVIDPGKMIQKPIHIFAPTHSFHGGRRTIVVRVSDNFGKSIEKQCLIFGPGTAASTGAKP
jgi:cytochrome c oxidase accessory protein FixG